MLHKLYLKDFILISNLEIDFTKGFSVFIGETGAGKSLIVDALQIVAGERVKNNVIRKNCDKAIVEAVFQINNNIKSILQQFNIEVDDEIIITKEITKEKTFTKLNGRNITNALLKQITKYLISIHAQNSLNEFINLSYINMIDELYQIDSSEYKMQYEKYLELLQEKALLLENDTLDENYLRFQIDEIDAVNPKINEDNELLEIQKNYLTSIKQQQNIENNLNEINLKGVYALGQLFSDEKLLDCYYEIEERISNIQVNMASIDDINIDEIQERLFKIQALKKKYGNIEAILSKKAELLNKLNLLDDREYTLSIINQNIQKQYDICTTIASKLSNDRKQASKLLHSQFLEELSDLNFNYVNFIVEFKEVEINSTGIDDINLLISLNKGENPKPVNEVASGGELSRIILALKSIFAKTQVIDTLIFDEIDVGVSGKVALSIGKKMHKISSYKQVLCVTHLAAVAACANNHYIVIKEYDNESTQSIVKKIDDQQLIQELAIISSSHSSSIAIENAKKLLELARSEIKHE